MKLLARRMRVWVESFRMRSQQIFISFSTARKIMQKYCRGKKRISKEERTRAGFIKNYIAEYHFILWDFNLALSSLLRLRDSLGFCGETDLLVLQEMMKIMR